MGKRNARNDLVNVCVLECQILFQRILKKCHISVDFLFFFTMYMRKMVKVLEKKKAH